MAQRRLLLLPGTITAVYLATGATWIVVGGLTFDRLFGSNHSQFVGAELLKGLAFVVVTGAILFVALRRYAKSLDVEQAQSRRRARFAELSPMPIVELDLEGRVIGANAAAHGAAAAASIELAELLPPLDIGALHRCAVAGESLDGLDRIVGGHEFRWSLFPVDSPAGLYAFGHERTAESRLELQVQHSARMESVGRLAAGVTHDINNILTAISGHTTLLELAAKGDPDCQMEIDGIKEQLGRARELGQRLLLVSRMRAGDAPAETVNLAEVLPVVATTVRHLLPSRVESRIDGPNEPLWVRLDVREFERAMLNLAANAADACPEGGYFEVRVDVHDGRAVLEVRDSGHGIPVDVLPRIFDPFFTTKPEGSGTGLGLAAVHSFVSRSAGTISVESKPGHGTTFRIALPLETAPGGLAAS